MRHLNYNHLLYFHTIAREGSIARAAEVLHLTPQTISGQIKRLEETVGNPLFDRVGRGLVLTETGQAVNRYAEEIFSLGTELAHWVSRGKSDLPNILNVGIVNSIPKLVAHGVLRSFVDAYRIAARVLAEDGAGIVDNQSDFLSRCLKAGKQELLQGRVFSAESISKTLYESGWKLAKYRGLLAAGQAEARREFHEELRTIKRRLDDVLAITLEQADRL